MSRNSHLAGSVLLAVSLLTPVLGAYAWDGVISGRVIQINGVGGSAGAPGNFDARIFLEGQPTACGPNSPSWGYINSNDANYKGLLAMLLMAQASAKVVTLYTNKDSLGNCQTGYLAVAS